MNRDPVNLVKLIVEEKLPGVMAKLGLPDTDVNRGDVIALAMNSLPAKYVTTHRGKQFAQLSGIYDAQFESDVIAELARACMKVHASPAGPEGGERPI